MLYALYSHCTPSGPRKTTLARDMVTGRLHSHCPDEASARLALEAMGPGMGGCIALGVGLPSGDIEPTGTPPMPGAPGRAPTHAGAVRTPGWRAEPDYATNQSVLEAWRGGWIAEPMDNAQRQWCIEQIVSVASGASGAEVAWALRAWRHGPSQPQTPSIDAAAMGHAAQASHAAQVSSTASKRPATTGRTRGLPQVTESILREIYQTEDSRALAASVLRAWSHAANPPISGPTPRVAGRPGRQGKD